MQKKNIFYQPLKLININKRINLKNSLSKNRNLDLPVEKLSFTFLAKNRENMPNNYNRMNADSLRLSTDFHGAALQVKFRRSTTSSIPYSHTYAHNRRFYSTSLFTFLFWWLLFRGGKNVGRIFSKLFFSGLLLLYFFSGGEELNVTHDAKAFPFLPTLVKVIVRCCSTWGDVSMKDFPPKEFFYSFQLCLQISGSQIINIY